MLDVIQSLWIGPRLSPLERLSITSFLQNGHPFHLYVYQQTEGVPDDAVLLDADEIIPSSHIFKYTGYDSYAGFANFFRYKLLCERGGWWVDLDTVCLQPFKFHSPFVFSSEMNQSAPNVNDIPVVGNCILKAPKASAVMKEAWAACQRSNPRELAWGQCGPALMQRLVPEFSLQHYVQPPEVFCPLHWPEWDLQLKPGIRWAFGAQTVAVHLWNELWRRAGADKNHPQNTDSLFEQLKRRYCGVPAFA